MFWTNAEFVEIEIGIGDWCSKGYLVEFKIGNHDLNETAITSQFQNKLQIASSHHCLSSSSRIAKKSKNGIFFLRLASHLTNHRY